MMNDFFGKNDELEMKDDKEYFTLEYQGKQCKAWIFAKKFIPDLDGNLYTQGYLFDGAEYHTIKIYLTK